MRDTLLTAYPPLQNGPFLPISVWKIGQQSIGVVGDLVLVLVLLKTLDRENSFSLFLAYYGEKIFFLYSKLN